MRWGRGSEAALSCRIQTWGGGKLQQRIQPGARERWVYRPARLLCLWACPYGNRGLTFCKQAGAQEQSDLHSRALLEVNFVILLPSTAPYVLVFLVCPPTHPGMGSSRYGR